VAVAGVAGEQLGGEVHHEAVSEDEVKVAILYQQEVHGVDPLTDVELHTLQDVGG
jgi:hypothetical protein